MFPLQRPMAKNVGTTFAKTVCLFGSFLDFKFKSIFRKYLSIEFLPIRVHLMTDWFQVGT